MSCTVCLKSACLTCFHSWRLDPNSHTNNPNSARGKNCSKTVEKKQKKQKTKSFTRPLSSFSDPLYGSKLFFCFLEVLDTLSVQQCQLLIFLFLFSFSLGSWDKFSPWQTSIGTALTPPLFILMSSLSFRFWLLSHQRKCTVKTALSPTSSGTPLDWCLLVSRGLGSSSLKLRLVLFKPGITKSDI